MKNIIAEGDVQLYNLIDYIIRTSGPRIGKKAVNAALTQLMRGIRKAVPKSKTKGHSNRSIKAALGRKVIVRSANYTAKIGFGVGKRKANAQGFAHVVVAGSKSRKRKRSGGSTGKINKTTIIRDGFFASVNAANAAAEWAARKELEKVKQ